MPSASKPTSLRIRTYQVGFGDCFLLTFTYPKQDRHLLIDFGTTGTPLGNDKVILTSVAEDIKKVTKGKLDAIVVTHRHRDHIRGFSTDARDGAPGTVIRALKPDLVTQPWTEDPKAAVDATGVKAFASDGKNFSATTSYLSSLNLMHMFAEQVVQASNASLLTPDHETLQFIGEDNLKNLSAVKNLQDMGKAAKFGSEYVNYGSKSKLSKVLPGVNVKVLGPPTIDQHKEVKTEASKNDEFWMMHQTFWADQVNARLLKSDARPAAGYKVAADLANVPIWARWFVHRARIVNASESLSIVRILDDAMN